VIGILLGLFMMWLVFDQLWGAPAIVQMKTALIALLRSLARLARGPVADNLQTAIEQSYALRETINNGFDKVRALGDGVLLEFGPTRQQDLSWRSSIRAWQPQLRMLFITRVALFKYRLQLPGFELPGALRRAQQDFDERLAKTLERMADGLESKPNDSTDELEVAFARLTETVRTSSPADQERMLAQQVKTFALLSERITNLALSLTKSIQHRGNQCTTR
jgi:multidrug resistance protein MdtO